MQLSLLIIDNLNLDTSFIGMRAFASADLLNYQQKFEVNDEAHKNVLLLEEKVKELEQVVFAICWGQD